MIKLLAFFVGVSTILGMLTIFWQGAQPGVVTSTTAALAATAIDAVGVNTTIGFKDNGGIIVVNNEMMNYSAKDTAGNCPSPIPGSSPCFTGLTRSIGSVAAQTHPVGSRVFDEVAGVANLSMQHDFTTFSSDLEQGANLSLDPRTWSDAITSRTANFIPTFLTGNWAPILWIFMFFQFLLILAVALLMISIVRGVRLF